MKTGRLSLREKIFSDLGHGGLAGEHPQQFSQEIQAAHRRSLEKARRDSK